MTVEFRDVPRAIIRMAPYNPRRISDAARQKLKKNLQKVGCVQPLVWNERTGNLVSGHQRLSIIDEAETSRDYTVGVAVVNLDTRDEKALNALLNNPQTQGEFSRELLIELLRDAERPALGDMGWSKFELEVEVGALPELAGILAQEEQATEPLLEELAQIEEIKAAKKKHLAEARQRPDVDAEYMVAVVFDTVGDKNVMLERLGLRSSMEHVKLDAIRQMLASGRIPPIGDQTDDQTNEDGNLYQDAAANV